MKSANLLHKCGLGDSDMNSTVTSNDDDERAGDGVRRRQTRPLAGEDCYCHHRPFVRSLRQIDMAPLRIV